MDWTLITIVAIVCLAVTMCVMAITKTIQKKIEETINFQAMYFMDRMDEEEDEEEK